MTDQTQVAEGQGDTGRDSWTLSLATAALTIENLRQPTALVKTGEIALQLVVIGIFCWDENSNCQSLARLQLYGSSIILGGFINAVVFLVLCLCDYQRYQQTPLELMLCTYYAVAYFTTAVLYLASTDMEAVGVFCLFLSFLYILDLYLAYTLLLGQTVAFPCFSSPHAQFQPGQNTPNKTGPNTPLGTPTSTPTPPARVPVAASASLPPTAANPAADALPPFLTRSYSEGNIMPDSEDQGNSNPLYTTNPTYPATMNYPPINPN